MATINSKQGFHQLPPQLQVGYFNQIKPLLGKVEDGNASTTADEQRYQLLDKIVEEFQATLSEEDKDDNSNAPQSNPQPQDGTPLFSRNVATLSFEAQQIEQQIEEITAGLSQPSNLAEFNQNLKARLLNSAKGKKIIEKVKQWLIAYKKLTVLEKKQLVDRIELFETISKIPLNIENEQEIPTTNSGKGKKLLYWGGGIVLIIGLFFLVKKLFRI
ncbi:MAG: hypothetical protein mread185_000181 [Mycoplasmataceae bacterium]|nr:MAG: hypothetical protein mread185_000181 [Mycoplasmataceae bacterium]